MPLTTRTFNILTTAVADTVAATELQTAINAGEVANALGSGQIAVGNASGVATPVTPTGIVTLSTAGAFAITCASADLLVGSSGNVAAAVPLSGDATITNAGVLSLAGTTAQGMISSSTTKGIGYATGDGVGSTATQLTSKATAFTLSALTGQITLNNASLGGATIVSATWTNTAVAATDVVVINHVSGGTVGAYTFAPSCGSGTVTLNIRNNTAGALVEAPVLQFVVVKGATT